MDKAEFRKRLAAKIGHNRAAFDGIYKDKINSLMGLSRSEIDEITPDTTDLEVYDELITVVKEASAANLAQADLVNIIQGMGEVAVSIAKKAAII